MLVKMATQAAAALLDELMGRTRNVLPQERHNKLGWDSPEVGVCGVVMFIRCCGGDEPCSSGGDGGGVMPLISWWLLMPC